MIICLSASHKKASLPILESLTFKDENEVMKEIRSIDLVQECLILQTCHRVEIYCVTNDASKDVLQKILWLWSVKVGVSSDVLDRIVNVYMGKEAISHIFYLAAGLESMVVGEDQILGQVRTTYVKAKELGTSGLVLGKVFMKAVNLGRRVRTETKINEGAVSISSAAIDLAVKELGDLSAIRALVIGAGEAASIVAETLQNKGCKAILIANRTFRRGRELAEKVSGKAIEFDRIYEVIPEVDLVVAAVSVNKPIFHAKRVEKTFNGNNCSRQICMIDISQPRAIEGKVGGLNGVLLRNIDDLKRVVEENIRNRLVEAEKAKEIIHEELARFEKQLAKLVVQPLVSEIYRSVEEIRLRELKRCLRIMKGTDKEKRLVIERFSRELTERILQLPVEELKEASLNNDSALLSAAEKLFRVKPEKGEKTV